MGSSKSPRFEPSLFRTADEQFQYAQNALGPAFGRALSLQQQYGPGLLAAARAGAPERSAFALGEFEAAQRGELAPGQATAFQQALRSADTARLGALGARQPAGAFQEALGTADLVRQRALQALGLLPTTSGTEIFGLSAPSLGTALELERQRGANLQAMLNARAQAKNAQRQFNTQMGVAGIGVLAAPFTGGASLGLTYGALGGAGGFTPPSISFPGGGQSASSGVQSVDYGGYPATPGQDMLRQYGFGSF